MEQMKIGIEGTRNEGRITGEIKVIHPLCSPSKHQQTLSRYIHSHPHTQPCVIIQWSVYTLLTKS